MSRYLTKLKNENAGLAWDFQVNPISCGNSVHYEQYVRFCALTDYIAGRSTTHLLVSESDEANAEKLIGFMTLRASSVVKIFDEYEEGRAALEITELAVDKRYERQGVGTYFLNLALDMAAELRENYAGVEYLSLCADPMVVPFYLKFGFLKLEDYYYLPREGWNRSCTPLLLKLSSQ